MIDKEKSWDILGMRILYEHHKLNCKCSYCKNFKNTAGISLPEDKSWNSWRVLYWRRNGYLHNVRWTLPKKLCK
jgi:hypothetical protein